MEKVINSTEVKNPADKSAFERLKKNRVAKNISKIALTGLVLLSFGRMTTETLDEVNAQNGGDLSRTEQLTGMVKRDFNAWDAMKAMYAGSDDEGFGVNQVVNIGSLIILAGAFAKAKEDKKKTQKRYF